MRSIALALLLASCGAAPRAGSPDRSPRAVADASGAWRALDPERAVMLAERARRLDPSNEDAREILARGQLALGRFEQAVRGLEGARDPVLLRLRARAQIALGRFGGALDSLEAAARHDRSEDPWSASVLGAVRAASALDRPYAIVSEGEALEVPLEALPLPIVRVRVDTVETLALIGTGADFAVLDPTIRNASGVIDELAIGALRVRGVPYVTRSLAPVREALGAEVGMVIGAQLLMRLHATLDGPRGRLMLRTRPPTRESPTSAPLFTPTGSFLVVPVSLGEATAWMTLDTAGLFPVALAPGDALREAAWRELEGGASVAIVRAARIGDLRVEQLPVVRGLLGDDHARAVAAPVAGSVGWALLGQMAIRFDARARRLYFE